MTDKARDEQARGPSSDRTTTERAEELVDRMAQGAGYLTSFVGLRILKGVSLALEEAEDIWAEAQSLRRERQSAEPDRAGGDPETVKATDAARRKAEELNVDLREVEGTGAGGRIVVGDVKKKAKTES